MLVYHSSDQLFTMPDVKHSRDGLDFGKGFLPNHCNLIYYRKSMIRFERLTSDNSSFFDKGMGLYAMNFPLHEQSMEENLINIFPRQ